MPNIWNLHFGFVEGKTGRAMVIGEWGGHYTGKDKTWQNALADYMIENCLQVESFVPFATSQRTLSQDNFYWCLNPNSGDTGGLLKDDWITINTAKAALIARIQPNPSQLSKNADGSFTFASGSTSGNCGGSKLENDDFSLIVFS